MNASPPSLSKCLSESGIICCRPEESGFICCSTLRQQIMGRKFTRTHAYSLLSSTVVCAQQEDVQTVKHSFSFIDDVL